MTSRAPMPVLLAVPGLGLAVAGLFHPHTLVAATADRWYVVHVAGLVFFPLVGLALAALVRGRRDPLAWVVRLGAFAFAVFYTALDVIYGVAAGYVTRQMGEGYQRSADMLQVLEVAVSMGEVGSWGLLVGGLALTVDQLVRRRAGGLPALAVPVGAWLVHVDHIFSPLGVLGMALVGVSTGLVALKLPGTRPAPGATFAGAAAS